MLAQRVDRVAPFSRRDLGRLLVDVALLVVAMTAIFAIDIIPAPVDVQRRRRRPGRHRRAAGDHLHRARSSPTQARAAARPSGRPAVRLHAGQGDRDGPPAGARLRVGDPGQSTRPSSRPSPRRIGWPSSRPSCPTSPRTPARRCRVSTPARWTAVRTESARILDQLESSELRDSDLADDPVTARRPDPGRARRGGADAGRRDHRTAPRRELELRQRRHRPGPRARGRARPAHARSRSARVRSSSGGATR